MGEILGGYNCCSIKLFDFRSRSPRIFAFRKSKFSRQQKCIGKRLLKILYHIKLHMSTNFDKEKSEKLRSGQRMFFHGEASKPPLLKRGWF